MKNNFYIWLYLITYIWCAQGMSALSQEIKMPNPQETPPAMAEMNNASLRPIAFFGNPLRTDCPVGGGGFHLMGGGVALTLPSLLLNNNKTLFSTDNREDRYVWLFATTSCQIEITIKMRARVDGKFADINATIPTK